MNDMEKVFLEKYHEAKKSIIDLSTHDATSMIALERGYVGITRILICLHEIGVINGQCKMIALPDFTYTKHADRWQAGFPYGCVITIDSKGMPFIPIDFRPNCCGVLMAEMTSLQYDLHELKQKLNSILLAHKEFNTSDFKRGNHFIGIYEAGQKYYLLVHGSLDYVKSLLYLERNKTLLNKVRYRNILGSRFNYLIDNDAEIYYADYLRCETLTMQFREILAQELFPDSKVIFNRTHEGFHSMDTIFLGGYVSKIPFSCPIMMSPGSNLSIIHVNKSIRLFKNNLYYAPHGGGYALSEVITASSFNTNPVLGNYILAYSNGAQLLSDDILKMPYYYRTNTDQCWCYLHNMGNIEVSMRPIFNLKV